MIYQLTPLLWQAGYNVKIFIFHLL